MTMSLENRRRRLLGARVLIRHGFWRALSVVLVVICVAAHGADWPTYRHDIARSGVTAERLAPPLSLRWVFKARHAPEPAWEPPKPAPIEGYLELPRVRFDDAFHVAVVGDSAYFGSSADNKVYCLDASTGRIRWEAFTGGPVRLAPTVQDGRLYVGSDDGFVYCLDARNGRVIWQFRAAPRDERVLGNGRMISLWPLRTGVLVDNGVAYFTAGIFPAEGIYVYAVRASDGTLIWKNDTCGDLTAGQRGLSFQGYLLASADTLFAPQGRVAPAEFERKSGRLIYGTPYFGKGTGGSYALLTDGHVLSGGEQIVAYDQKTLNRLAWFSARRVIVTRDTSYVVDEKEMLGVDRKAHWETSLRYRCAKEQLQVRRWELDQAQRNLRTAVARTKLDKEAIGALEKQLKALAEAGEQAGEKVKALKSQRDTLNEKLRAGSDELEKLQEQVSELTEQLKAAQKEVEDSRAALATCVNWRRPSQTPDSLILASDVLFAGGEGQVVAVDSSTGKELWTAKVEGKARGLAAANGHLFVSTDTGRIYCFGTEASRQAATVVQPLNPSPYPQDELTPIFEAAAEAIVQKTGIKKGYCLVWGCGTGRFAFELARRTQLMIYGIEPDAQKVAGARKALDEAGLYGRRVCVERLPLSQVPYSDYFANLIVSETALVSGKVPGDAAEMFRMLRPLGGVAVIGQPAEGAGRLAPLRPAELRGWIARAGLKGARISQEQGVWLTLTRGPLEGARDWTHQFADPANTACSGDRLAKCPLGVLWFGAPGPGKMVNRHARAAAPLAVNGRMFVQGENVIMAYDAYNGTRLWERDIPGAIRTYGSSGCSNLAATDDSLFVAVGDKCLRLDAATGETKTTYTLPPSQDGTPRKWGYVAVVDKLLFGSTTRQGRAADSIFAIDMDSGEHLWAYHGKSIMHMTIAVGDGCVFFADKSATAQQRLEALKERMEQLGRLKGVELEKAQRAIETADVRVMVALEMAAGKIRWQKPVDVSDCANVSTGGGELTVIYRDKVLLLCTAPWNGHYWKQFFAGEFSRRTIIALSSEDGGRLWSRRIGYRSRPLVVGNTIIAEPWAYELRTGEPRRRANPVTGRSELWQFVRPGHHCGWVSASASALFFRSWSIGWYDLIRDQGTSHFGSIRPGCWINCIPANGLVVIPEASSGCMCAFPNVCTVVLKPRRLDRTWGMFSASGSTTPVRHMAINLGAPGDRRDEGGTLWLAYPRPSRHGLVLQFRLAVSVRGGGGYFQHDPEGIRIRGTDAPWVFASGCVGLTRCELPLIGEGQPPAVYTVRLAFAEPVHDRSGQRVFDIKLQDEVVQKDFDIFREAGGSNRAVVKQFKDIEVAHSLKVELVPKAGELTEETAPVLCGIEVFRE